MIDVHALATLMVVSMLGIMSPGPNFVVVAQRALLHGRRKALITAAGVVTVSALWASASLFGLAVVFKLFPWLHMTLIVGAAYLVWMGIKLWRYAPVPMPAGTVEGQAGTGGWLAFRAGLATICRTPRRLSSTLRHSPPQRLRRTRPRLFYGWRWC